MEQNDEKHSLTRQDIERHLQSALAAATPNVWSKLDLSVPQDVPEKVSVPLGLERRLRYLGAAAACICLIAGGGVYHYEYLQVASVVGIDVNPSLRISLNRRDKVLKAEALNPDGAKVLDVERELKGETLETAVNQVVDSLVKEGYLKEGQQRQAVLVSVSGKNEKQTEKVKTAAAANMEDAIAQKQVSAVVYDQTIQVTKELEELAQAYQVSVGKAGFIEQLVQENEVLNQDSQVAYERMMSQPMEVITQEIHENQYSVSPQVKVVQVEPAGEKEPKEGREENHSRKPEMPEGMQSDISGEDAQHGQERTEVKEQEPERSLTEERSSDAKEEEPTAKEREKAEAAGESVQEKITGGNRENQKKADTENEPDREKQTESKQEEETAEGTEDKGLVEKTSDLLESGAVSSDAEEPGKEATSSTAGAETEPEPSAEKEPEQEEGQDKVNEAPEGSSDRAEEQEEGSDAEAPKEGANKADKPEESTDQEDKPEEDTDKTEKTEEKAGTHSGGTEQEHFVEYSQPVEDKFFLTNSPEIAEEPTEKDLSEGGRENVPAEEKTSGDEDEKSVKEEPPSHEDGESVKEEPSVHEDEESVKEERSDQEGGKSIEEKPLAHDGEKSVEEDLASDENEDKDSVGNSLPDSKDRESAEESSSDDKDREEGSESGHQVIRVKVEEKEHKEEEEPVYASQLLGFSQRRLLCKGPGVFEFIIADPGRGRQEEEETEEEFEMEEAEFEESESEEALEEEENWALEEDWQMGEWLRIGPGYSSY